MTWNTLPLAAEGLGGLALEDVEAEGGLHRSRLLARLQGVEGLVSGRAFRI